MSKLDEYKIKDYLKNIKKTLPTAYFVFLLGFLCGLGSDIDDFLDILKFYVIDNGLDWEEFMK